MITAKDILLAADNPESEGIVFIDEASLYVYKLYVNNGILTMSNIDDPTNGVSQVSFVDRSTGTIYDLVVSDAKLEMREQTEATDDIFDSINLVDEGSDSTCELYVSGGKLRMSTEAPDDGELNVLTIDIDTRTIDIPSTVRNLGVESDDDVLRLKFKMPRYYCGIDMADFAIRINYENAKREGDVYEVTNPIVDVETISFVWLVGRPAVAYGGDVRFIVCLKKFGEDGETVEKEFNTTIASLPVLEGLETAEAVFQEYPDIIMQFRREQEEQIEKAVIDWMASNEVLSDDRVNAAVTLYFTENPVKIDDQQVGALVDDYFSRNPVTGVTDEMVASAVEDYFEENPIEIPEVDLSDYYTRNQTQAAIADEIALLDFVGNTTFVNTVASLEKNIIKPCIVELENFYPNACDAEHAVKSWDGNYSMPQKTGTQEYSGSCGSNLSWSLTDKGCLIISGSGPMPDYDSFSAPPWYMYDTDDKFIKTIYLDEGITHIGDNAFHSCTGVTGTLVIPSTVKTIGELIIRLTNIDTIIVKGNSRGCYSNSFQSSVPASLKFVSDPVLVNYDGLFDGIDEVYYQATCDGIDEVSAAYAASRPVLLYNHADNSSYSLSSVTDQKITFTRTLGDGVTVSIIEYSIENGEFSATRDHLATKQYVIENSPTLTNTSYRDDEIGTIVSDDRSTEIALSDVHVTQYGRVVCFNGFIGLGKASMKNTMFTIYPNFSVPEIFYGQQPSCVILTPDDNGAYKYGGRLTVGGSGKQIAISTSPDYNPGKWSSFCLTYITI